MDSERWQQIEHLYHSALERERGERSLFLAGACQGDDELRREVESLLAQKTGSSGLLARRAWQSAATLAGSGVMVGQTLGHYRIESKLGEGGMGVVYEARDTHLDRPVAIKVLPAEAVSNSSVSDVSSRKPRPLQR